MKTTKKQIQALDDISKGRSRAELNYINPKTRASLFRLGLIAKDWNHRHAMGDIEYLKLTDEGKKVAAEALGWEV